MIKPRVVFPYTEAGFGHMMPMDAIADKFEELYGDRVECVRSKFFTETDDKKLAVLGDRLRDDVIKTAKSPLYGRIQTFSMDFFQTRLSMWGTMNFLKMGSKRRGIEHMEELKPDMVVSTHFATNYFAEHCKNKPLTVVYFPDIVVNPMYRYPCDLLLVTAPTGYERALRTHKRRFSEDNLARVPFIIRKEAFAVTADKTELRRKLGFEENKFTVVLAEGGNGIGNMERICEIILKRNLPVTLVPVCGKNKALYEKFLRYKPSGETDFRPAGLVENMFELLAAADVFCGKSGANMCAEVCYSGLPHIITRYASNIERHNGEYYIGNVGNALKIFSPEKVADKIEEFIACPALLAPYREAALARRADYGAEKCARLIFGLLCGKFPELAPN